MLAQVVIGVLVGLLFGSVMLNAYLYFTREDLTRSWKLRVQEADDARKAQEVRSVEQIDAMLDRISTSPRLEVGAPAGPAPDLTERPYISDLPYDDDHWNDFRQPAEGDDQ